MTASLYQGESMYTPAVGQEMRGRLPGPIPALKQGSEGPVMSDMQVMMENERKQHEDQYKYANGHNDHGMGQ